MNRRLAKVTLFSNSSKLRCKAETIDAVSIPFPNRSIE